jgi:hypothetical protein
MGLTATTFMVCASSAVGPGYYFYCSDITAMNANLHAVEFENNAATPVAPFSKELQIGLGNSEIFAIRKLSESIANNLAGGKVMATRLEIVTPGADILDNNFDDATVQGWAAVDANTAISNTSNRLRGTKQNSPDNIKVFKTVAGFTIGKTYRIKWDEVTAAAGPNPTHLVIANSGQTTTYLVTDSNGYNHLALGSGTTKYAYFTAKETTLRFELRTGSNATNGDFFELDNVLIEESALQIDRTSEFNLANKASIDEAGFCGRSDVIEYADNMYVFMEKQVVIPGAGTQERMVVNGYVARLPFLNDQFSIYPTEIDDVSGQEIKVWDV